MSFFPRYTRHSAIPNLFDDTRDASTLRIGTAVVRLCDVFRIGSAGGAEQAARAITRDPRTTAFRMNAENCSARTARARVGSSPRALISRGARSFSGSTARMTLDADHAARS